jgi:hypothetical protein
MGTSRSVLVRKKLSLIFQSVTGEFPTDTLNLFSIFGFLTIASIKILPYSSSPNKALAGRNFKRSSGLI